jgi:uncharacterized protein
VNRLAPEERVRRLLLALAPYEPALVYLFGSAARYEADELSDLDVVVLKETAMPFLDRLSEVARLLPPEIGAVDLLVYTPAEFRRMQEDGNAFAETIASEGRVIYARPEIRG